jgi:hypothetical protein
MKTGKTYRGMRRVGGREKQRNGLEERERGSGGEGNGVSGFDHW